MTGLITIFKDESNFEEACKQHPEYIKIYRNVVENEESITIQLSEEKNNDLYLISNMRLKDVKEYFAGFVSAPKSKKQNVPTHENNQINEEHAAKRKQQNLASIFKKSK